MDRGTLGAAAKARSAHPCSAVLTTIKLALSLINAIFGEILTVKINDPKDPLPVNEADAEELKPTNEPTDLANTDDQNGTAGLGSLRNQLRKKSPRLYSYPLPSLNRRVDRRNLVNFR